MCRKVLKFYLFITFSKFLNEAFMRNNNLKFLIENFINLFLINDSFKNSEKLIIKVETLAHLSTHTKKSMPEKNGIIPHIRYHIKGRVVTNFGTLS
jgi:hypothetical protein